MNRTHMKTTLFMLSAYLLTFCTHTQSTEEVKNEIRQAEKDFQKMTVDKGIAEAFYFYAAPDAVIKRENDTLIIGRENIKTYYKNKHLLNTTLEWAPDHINVSQSGDLAYTYGKYTWKALKDNVEPVEFTGIFHTVWKKQADGSWKYVWD